MKRKYSFSLIVLAWVVSACSSPDPSATNSDVVPSNSPALLIASPTLPVESPEPSESPTALQPEATREIAISLPAPVCLLDPEKMAVIRIEPDDLTSEIVSPRSTAITDFDTRIEDGKFVYSTVGGELLLDDDDEVRSVFQVSPSNGYEFSIDSFELSPDGTKVAVSVTFEGWETNNESISIVEENAGLYILNLENGDETKLLSHNYPNSEAGESVVDGTIFIDPLWSPDGEAIFMKTINWEWYSVAWIYPIDEPGENLHRPVDIIAWSEGSWSSDSTFLLLSGRTYSDVSNLDRVDRSSESVETLIDGFEEQTYISDSHVVENRILFTGSSSDRPDFHIYDGLIAADTFTFEVAGYSDALCSTFKIVWDSKGEYGILSCGTSIRTISSDGTLNFEFSHLIPDTNLAELEQFGWCA